MSDWAVQCCLKSILVLIGLTCVTANCPNLQSPCSSIETLSFFDTTTGNCYFHVDTDKTWEDAMNYCKSWAQSKSPRLVGRLAWITNESLYDNMETHLGDLSEVWIGMRKKENDGSRYSIYWYSNTTTAALPVSWSVELQYDSNSDSCMRLKKFSDDKIHNKDCTNTKESICELTCDTTYVNAYIASSCTDHCTALNGYNHQETSCYLYDANADGLNFDDADNRCKAIARDTGLTDIEGRLAHFEDLDVYNNVNSKYTLSGDVWIGMKKGTANNNNFENIFWMTGSCDPNGGIVSETFSDSTSFNDVNQKCVRVKAAEPDFLRDKGCNTEFGYICEIACTKSCGPPTTTSTTAATTTITTTTESTTTTITSTTSPTTTTETTSPTTTTELTSPTTTTTTETTSPTTTTESTSPTTTMDTTPSTTTIETTSPTTTTTTTTETTTSTTTTETTSPTTTTETTSPTATTETTSPTTTTETTSPTTTTETTSPTTTTETTSPTTTSEITSPTTSMETTSPQPTTMSPTGAKCPVLLIENGKLDNMQNFNPHGSTQSVVCNPGYQPVETSTTCNNGQWSRIPGCKNHLSWRCPNGGSSIYTGAACYWLSNSATTWEASFLECSTMGGKLSPISSSDLWNERLSQFIQTSGHTKIWFNMKFELSSEPHQFLDATTSDIQTPYFPYHESLGNDSPGCKSLNIVSKAIDHESCANMYKALCYRSTAYAQFQFVKNKKLVEGGKQTKIGQKIVDSFRKCLAECRRVENCLAVNYLPNSMECQFYSQKYSDNEGAAVATPENKGIMIGMRMY